MNFDDVKTSWKEASGADVQPKNYLLWKQRILAEVQELSSEPTTSIFDTGQFAFTLSGVALLCSALTVYLIAFSSPELVLADQWLQLMYGFELIPGAS